MGEKLKKLSIFLVGLLIFQSFQAFNYQYKVKADTTKTFTQNTAYPPKVGDTYINSSDGLTYTVSNIINKQVSGKVGIEYGFNYTCTYVDTANVMISNPNPEKPFSLNNPMSWPQREDTSKAKWEYEGYSGTVSLPAAGFGYKGNDGVNNFKNFWNVPLDKINNGSDTANRDGSIPPIHSSGTGSIVENNMPHPDANMAYYVDENNIQYPVTVSAITTDQKAFGIYIANPLNNYIPPKWTQPCQVWADDYFVTLTATVYTVTYTYSQQATVTVKYVDQSTNADIATVDVYNNVSEGSQTYNAKTVPGYTLQGSSTQTINVQTGQKYTVIFKYSKDATTSSVTVNFLDISTNQPIDTPNIYNNETPGSHAYYAKTISGYVCTGSDINGGSKTSATSQTLNVVAGQTYVINFYYDVSKLPTVKLYAPTQAIAGDPVDLMAIGKTNDPSATSLKVSIYIDGYPTETINGDTVTFDASETNKQAKAEGNGFFNPGTVKVHAIVTDNFGNSAEDDATIQVVLPTPSVTLNQTGTLKENRRFIVDASGSYSGGQNATINWSTAKWTITPLNGASMNDVRVQSHTTGSTNGTILYDPSRSITAAITGVPTIDLEIKKAGAYTIQCTVSNNYNMSGSNEATYTIIIDSPPVPHISGIPKTYRDPNNPDSNGKAQATIPVSDESIDNDNDIIGQRVWLYAFDKLEDGSYDNDLWYIYKNGSWQPFGTYTDVKNLANNPSMIAALNTGNLTNVELQSIYVGKYDFELIVREEFGQEYIPQFTNESDKKLANTLDH